MTDSTSTAGPARPDPARSRLTLLHGAGWDDTWAGSWADSLHRTTASPHAPVRPLRPGRVLR